VEFVRPSPEPLVGVRIDGVLFPARSDLPLKSGQRVWVSYRAATRYAPARVEHIELLPAR
jgi:hypothetical protein